MVMKKSKKELDPEVPQLSGRILPVLPLKGGVLFPNAMLPITIGQERSIKLIDEALIKDKTIVVVSVNNQDVEVPQPEDLYAVGCLASIAKMMKLKDEHMSVLVQGQSRIRIGEYTQSTPYLQASIEVIDEAYERDVETDALMVSIKNLFQRAVELSPNIPSEVGFLVMNMDDPRTLADMIAANFNISVGEKQEILELIDIKKRLERVNGILNKELQVLELGSKIQGELKKEMDKNQRDYYLREQLKAIQRELGEDDERTVEARELKEKIIKAQMPEEVRTVAEKELDRLSKMSPAAAEYTVSRTYLDWLIDLPWAVATPDNLDIELAQQVLDDDHYDLEKVKKRIVEYLAVRKLKPEIGRAHV